MKITLVGTGMDGIGTLTHEAADAIAQAELLAGAERMLRPYRDSGKALLCSYDCEEIAARLRNGTEHTAAVLLSGDCGFFSMAKKLRRHLAGMEVRSIPGISAPVALCAALGLSWEQMRFVSLHGAESSIAVHVRQNRYCCFLLGGRVTAAAPCQRLCDYGLGSVTVHIGDDLGGDAERIISGTADTLTSHPAENLCTVITEHPGFCEDLHVPDDVFRRSTIPMTKAEVRCIATAALAIRSTDICWDIGCGTGAVSAELALHCPAGSVYAVDRDPEAVRLTQENAKLLGCDNIIVQEGLFPASPVLPAPDKVFIGGSAGKLPEIFAVIHELRPAARIAVTAVSLETLFAAQVAFAAYDIPCTVTQLAVTRTRRCGSHTMFHAQNPIFLLVGGGT